MPNVNKFPSSKLKLDEFFLNWLSSQESQKLVSDSDATQVERPHVFSLASRAVAVAVEDLPNDGTVRSPNPSYSLSPPQKVLNLLEDAKAGRPLHSPVPNVAAATGSSPLSPSSTHALLQHSTHLQTPPLSPSKSGSMGHGQTPGSPTSPSRAAPAAVPPGTPPRVPTPPSAKASGRREIVSEPSPGTSPLKPRSENEANKDSYAAIPKFYKGVEFGVYSAEKTVEKCKRAQKLFGDAKELDVDGFKRVTQEVCELPSFFAPLIMHRANGTDPMDEGVTSESGEPVAQPGSPSAPANRPRNIRLDVFEKYWHSTLRKYSDDDDRAFHVLRGERAMDPTEDQSRTGLTPGTQPELEHLEHCDFRPILRELLRTHPGLEFLKDSPEFQDRYLETVTFRIFFEVNSLWNGKLTRREFRRSDLLAAMRKTDSEDDVNKCLRYFSYEHFYVMYCKFWELDTDHDFLIDKEDLLRYGNHALTYRAVDRVFSQAPKQFTSGVPNKMGYEDFCWFVLSEEDTTNPRALEYWLRVVDLDGDGVIRPREMLHFYEEQVQRMECLNQEPVLWEDVLCQMMDILQPEVDGQVSITDLKNSKLSGTFFNVLFNLNKFIAFESRDPFSIRQEREEPHLTEWDRFARGEYIRLSMEEEENEGENGWDDQMAGENGSF